ncbi:hypothetical protein FB567DRAFT_578820 [Paraphoma chrysanthemicola]|uniref:Uncharacterized protein n=1 Tax=Paraphoma chrysanthemicola TaxID=798071 RepID=A0A8K0W044_9PLEO|nr:hypothetical protein FB567DRAFT_578820 [Paraphoma chrysanthemicola]
MPAKTELLSYAKKSKGITEEDIEQGCPMDVTRWPLSQLRESIMASFMVTMLRLLKAHSEINKGCEQWWLDDISLQLQKYSYIDGNSRSDYVQLSVSCDTSCKRRPAAPVEPDSVKQEVEENEKFSIHAPPEHENDNVGELVQAFGKDCPVDNTSASYATTPIHKDNAFWDYVLEDPENFLEGPPSAQQSLSDFDVHERMPHKDRSRFRKPALKAAEFLELQVLEDTNGVLFNSTLREVNEQEVVDADILLRTVLNLQLSRLAHAGHVDLTASTILALECFVSTLSTIMSTSASTVTDFRPRKGLHALIAESDHARLPWASLVITRPDMTHNMAERLAALTYYDDEQEDLQPTLRVIRFTTTNSDFERIADLDDYLGTLEPQQLAHIVIFTTQEKRCTHTLRKVPMGPLALTKDDEQEFEQQEVYVGKTSFGVLSLPSFPILRRRTFELLAC